VNSPADPPDSLLKAHRSDVARLRAPAISRFTRDEIIASIKCWQERYGEPPKVIDWDPSLARRSDDSWRAERFEAGDWPTIAIVRRQFGNMSKARFAAGARPRRGPTRARSHVLSDAEILAAIRDWTRIYGEPPATADWAPARARGGGQLWRVERYYAGSWPSTKTVIRRFGTFSAAIRQAGLIPRPRGRHTGTSTTLARDVRAPIRHNLETCGLSCGPAVLAARVRRVAAVRNADDPIILRAALIDLAAAALSWADVVTTSSERPWSAAA